MELKHITKNVMYFNQVVNIGAIKDDDSSVILVDSGIDDDAAKKILKILAENSLFVKAIINTHSHADHCGGNNYIKQKTGAKIYAPEFEAGIIQYPLLEPTYLFSGAMPIKELQVKFLMAKPSVVDHVIGLDQKRIKFDNVELDVVLLHGHSPRQIGIGYDGVLFCADSIFSEEIIEKYKIPYNVDIMQAKKTLEFLKTAKFDYFIPAHVAPISSIEKLVELADVNLMAIKEVENQIIASLLQEKTASLVLRDLCNHFEIILNAPAQYFLLHTTIMAHLGSLHAQEKIGFRFSDNELVWHLV